MYICFINNGLNIILVINILLYSFQICIDQLSSRLVRFKESLKIFFSIVTTTLVGKSNVHKYSINITVFNKNGSIITRFIVITILLFIQTTPSLYWSSYSNVFEYQIRSISTRIRCISNITST